MQKLKKNGPILVTELYKLAGKRT